MILGAGAATEPSSCDALGLEVARAIRENAPGAAADRGRARASGNRCALRTLTALARLALGAAAMAAGSAPVVARPGLLREPPPEPIPLRIGVHFPPEFRSFRYHPIGKRTLAPFALGEPSVRLLHAALTRLFELRIEAARYQLPRATGDPPSPQDAPDGVMAAAQITYGFTLYSHRGERIGSWAVAGAGQHAPPNPPVFAASFPMEDVKRSFERAMREAAWLFTSGFRDVPEVRSWLDEQGI
jgi:hypothetical protein